MSGNIANKLMEIGGEYNIDFAMGDPLAAMMDAYRLGQAAAPATPEPVEDMMEWLDKWCQSRLGLPFDKLNSLAVQNIPIMLMDFAAAQRGKPKP